MVILWWYSMDGTAPTTGRLSDLTTRVEKVAPECGSMHCVIRREMLASQKLSPEIDNILQDAIKIISHVRVHALNSLPSIYWHSSAR